eukprot:TRINITY_DN76274_c0_g1_i1.p1 TRINITY_DN76274_c0_g1~~TRINITY_DN76274_c0_g1_i1.p1  ORF type:complete len:359 (+),score=45.38 TRINITY_DN76274_c0_g1_i1:94-1077(+)
MAALWNAFHDYAAEAGMDGRCFLKCLRNSALVDEDFCAAEADLVFTKCKARGCRRMCFDRFVQALKEVAVRKDMTDQQVQDIICLSCGYETGTGDVALHDSIGPEGFYHDFCLYTGTHEFGSPGVVGSGSKDAPTRANSKELVDRDGIDEFAGQQVTNCRRAGNIASHGPVHSIRTRRPVAALKGPERFFYDRSTYTGTHRNGGPDVRGNGIPKEGYGDLSELVCRDHIQDDNLNRRRFTASAMGSIAKERNSTARIQNNDAGSPPLTPGEIPLLAAPLPVLLGSWPACSKIQCGKVQAAARSVAHAGSPTSAGREDCRNYGFNTTR